MRLNILSNDDLKRLIESAKKEGKLLIGLCMTQKGIKFAERLECEYFAPGTAANEDFELITSPGGFLIIVSDTPKIRSVITILARSCGLRALRPFTRLGEYLQKAERAKNLEQLEAVLRTTAKDVERYVSEHITPLNYKGLAWINIHTEKEFDDLVGVIKKARKTDSAFVLRNHKIVVYQEKGQGGYVYEPGHHIIFINFLATKEASLLDFLLNFVLDFAHELMHIGGINRELEICHKEFQVAESFLGIYPSDEQKSKMIQQAEAADKQK